MQAQPQRMGTTVRNTQRIRPAALSSVRRPQPGKATSAIRFGCKGNYGQRRYGLGQDGFSLTSVLVAGVIASITASMVGNMMVSQSRMQKRVSLGQDIDTQKTLLHQEFIATSTIANTKEIDGCSWQKTDKDPANQWIDVDITCGNSAISRDASATLVKPVDLTPIGSAEPPATEE